MHPGFAHDSDFRARFAREVAVSRKVTGPWTAAVVDADPDAPTPWLATEYVPGPSLDVLIDTSGTLPPHAVHVLAAGLAKALVTIHDAGLVHRDVKPSNVLMGEDGPRLIDFGISRAVDGTRLTSTGMVIGTPAFMSPEQTEGADIGPASDVFSLGAVLVMAATGVGPFGQGTPMVLLRRILTTEPNLGALTEPLRGLVAECLRLDAARRPTAPQIVEQLEPPQAPVPTPAPTPVPMRKRTAVLPAQAVRPAPADTQVEEPEPRSPVRRRVFLIGAGAAVLGTGAVLIGRTGTPTPGDVPQRQVWAFGVPSPLTAMAGTDDTVYVANDKTVTALDAGTGKTIWSWSWYNPLSSLAASGTGVVAGIAGLTLVLDGSTGTQRWERPGDLQIAVTEQLVVMKGLREAGWELYARDSTTGAEWWSRPIGMHDYSSDANASSVHGIHLWFTERIETIDVTTGELRWSRPVSTERSAGSMIVIGDLLCVVESSTTAETNLLALDASTGAERWRVACTRSSIMTTDGQLIYLASARGVAAVHPDTGEQRWSAPADWSWSIDKGVAVAPNGPVVVGSKNYQAELAFAVDGRSTRTFTTDRLEASDSLFGPLIARRTAVVGAGNKVYSVALD